MKNIFINSVVIHLIVTMLFISFAVTTGGVFSYALALFYVLITIRNAIDIADFEMSKMGKVVETKESGKYKLMEVYFTK